MAESKSKSSSSSSSSVDALEGFLILAKTSTGAQCVMLIKEVLKHPAIYVFGELLDTPNMKALDSTEHKPWLDVLRLFAYGTYADYKAQSSSLPQLTPQHLIKLKQLSIVSMAAKSKSLPYSQLIHDLDLANVRELEDMIIDCIYLELISGKLNQKTSRFEVSFAIGRDIGPDDVQAMIQRLEGWVASSQATLQELEKKAAQANQAHERSLKDEAALEAKKKDVLEALKVQKESGVEEDGRGKRRSAKGVATASSVAAAAGAGLRSIFGGGAGRH